MKKKKMTVRYIALLCCTGMVLCGCTRKTESADGLQDLLLTQEEAYEQTPLQETAAAQGTPEDSFSGAKGDGALSAAAKEAAGAAEVSGCYVYICGAVQNPGVYYMEADERVYAVIERAGGFSETACEDYVNQAKRIADGLKIWIPTKEEAKEIAGQELPGGSGSGGGENAGLEYPVDGAGRAAAGAGAGLVNINTAGKEELCTLAGIGEAKAEAILTYRSGHGNFLKKEDIMNVAGIKQSGYEKIKDQITVKQE